MTPTQPTPPTPPPGPPTGPPSGPPPASPGAPPKKRGPSVPLVAFIVVVVLLVVAAALAIFAFVGKSSESDDKDKAQKELASTKRDLARTRERLGGAQAAGQTLGDLLRQAGSAADDLKTCTDSSGNLREGMIDALNSVQGGGSINDRIDGLNQQIDSNRNSCSTSDQAYQNLLNALRQAGNQ
ncbi:MAG TPA: hypothetical protein VGK05_02805 [Acidimicrobiia bacterium]